MKKYKIISGRSELTPEQIEKGKDFSKIKKSINNPSSPGIKMFLSAVGIVAVGLLIYYQNSQSNNSDTLNTVKLNSAGNLPQQFAVNTSKDTVLEYKTGSHILIPSNAFVDENGTVVEGDVEISYREFHNIGEILLSEIPMQYDSAGTTYFFESAGMFEIKGRKNGKEISLKPGKSIEVQMASYNNEANKFNQYYYDSKQGIWKFIKRDLIDIENNTNDTSTIANSHTNENKNKNQNYKIILDVDIDEFPELASYKNLAFEVLPETRNFNPNTSSVAWDNVSVERTAETNKYKFNFSNIDTQIVIISKPVELRESEIAFENYKVKTKLKNNNETTKQNKLTKDLSDNKAIIQVEEDKERQRGIVQNRIAESENNIYRTFQVLQFGVYNSDCPQSLPTGQEVLAKFRSNTGKDVQVSTIYLVEKGVNALYCMYDSKKLRFNPNNENYLIVVLKDNSVGAIKPEDFKNIASNEKEHMFELNVISKAMYSPDDILKLLEL